MNKPRFAQLLLAYFVAFILIVIAILPNCAHAEEKKATVGIYITKLFDTNLHTNEFSTTFWLWVLYKPFDNWSPESSIDFLNAKDVEKLTSTSDQTKNGQNWWQGKYRVIAIADWDIKNYPFDEQDIYLLAEDNLLEANHLQFIADTKNSGVAQDAISQDWKLISFNIKTTPVMTPTTFGDPHTQSGSAFSRIIIHLKLKRENSWTKFVAVFSAGFISLLLSFFVTIIPFKEWSARFSVCAASTFAAVGSHYSLQNLLPYSRYFTLSDKIELEVFIYLLLMLSTAATSSHLYARNNEFMANVINRTMMIASVIIIPLVNYLLLRAFI